MFAVIETGGKQYKVSVGDVVEVEKLDAEVGSKVDLKVLMIVDGETVRTGTPTVENASVVAEVLRHDKAKKIVVIKYRAKKNERSKRGHRQPFTAVKILEIK